MRSTTIGGISGIAFVFCFLATMTAVFAQDDRLLGGRGITVFRDRNFRGASATYQNDISNLADTGFNDQISSVRVGPGEQWEMCDAANYRGRCAVVSGEESDLRRNAWDNRVSSLRRLGGGYPGPEPSPGPENPYIVLYTETNYRGTPTNYDQATAIISGNNRAESVTVGRGEWQLCSGARFTGRCVTVSQSVPDLASVGMSGRVRSVRPAVFAPRATSSYIVVFTQTDYRGTPTNYNRSRPNILRLAGSITVGAGVWEICSGRNFTGRCETIRRSVPNIEQMNIGRVIRSVRPVGREPR